MKTLAYATVLTALTAMGAHAQAAYEVRSTTTTETADGVTTQTTTEYSETVVPVEGMVIGDEAATPDVEATGSVRVKLPDGKIVSVADSADTPWTKTAQMRGFDRFTFDPINNLFVAGKGEAKFDNNWDDSGNRVQKVVAAPKPKKAAPVEEKPADEPTPEASVAEPAAETPVEETPAEMPAAQ